MLCRQFPGMNILAMHPTVFRRFGFAVFVLAALLLPRLAGAEDAPKPSPPQPIDNPVDIKRLLNDQTVYGRYSNGDPWAEYQSPDGRTAYQEKNCIYRGHWWVAGDQVCYRYEEIENGTVFCFRLYHDGPRLDFYYELAPGDWQLNAYSIDVTPGNPEKLPLEGRSCVPSPGV
jgi:hypothetical protein